MRWKCVFNEQILKAESIPVEITTDERPGKAMETNTEPIVELKGHTKISGPGKGIRNGIEAHAQLYTNAPNNHLPPNLQLF